MQTIVLTEPIHADGIALLEAAAGVRLVKGWIGGSDALAAAITQADAIGTRVHELTAEVLASANHLRVVCKHGVGTDNIDIAHCAGRGIPVLITAQANKVSVAEQTLMFMLALAKDVTGYDRAVRAGVWDVKYSLRAFELAGKTLLLVGFGRIGREVAARARAFGMQVVVVDIAPDQELAERLGCEVVTGDFRPHLARADILTLHVPRTPLTADMMGAAEFAAMKPGAVFVNCARGGLVDEAALVQALAHGPLRSAGLDVFDAEPLPATHPLLALPNVLVSAHSAASTAESGRRMAVDLARNLLDALEGRMDPGNLVAG
jgi:D-3-phosphoglycerate dehydrogenase